MPIRNPDRTGSSQILEVATGKSLFMVTIKRLCVAWDSYQETANNFSLCLLCLYAGLSRPIVRLPLLFDEVMTVFLLMVNCFIRVNQMYSLSGIKLPLHEDLVHTDTIP